MDISGGQNNDISLIDGILVSGNAGPFSDISNKGAIANSAGGNFSCIILRSNEKTHSSNSKHQKENLFSNMNTNSSFFKGLPSQTTNFGQRLEDLEAGAKAL